MQLQDYCLLVALDNSSLIAQDKDALSFCTVSELSHVHLVDAMLLRGADVQASTAKVSFRSLPMCIQMCEMQLLMLEI